MKPHYLEQINLSNSSSVGFVEAMHLHVCGQFSCQMYIHGLLSPVSFVCKCGDWKKENWSVFDLTNEAGDVASLTWGFLSFLRMAKRNSLFKKKNPKTFKHL